MAIRFSQFILGLGLLALLTACGQPGAPAAATQVPAAKTAPAPTGASRTQPTQPAANPGSSRLGADSCPSQAEVQQVLGGKVTANISSDVGGQFCQYLGDAGLVNITIFSDASGYEDLKSSGAQSVTGVGDSAYWVAAARILSVLKGRNYFTVALQLNPPATVDTAKALAVKVVNRLK